MTSHAPWRTNKPKHSACCFMWTIQYNVRKKSYRVYPHASNISDCCSCWSAAYSSARRFSARDFQSQRSWASCCARFRPPCCFGAIRWFEGSPGAVCPLKQEWSIKVRPVLVQFKNRHFRETEYSSKRTNKVLLFIFFLSFLRRKKKRFEVSRKVH